MAFYDTLKKKKGLTVLSVKSTVQILMQLVDNCVPILMKRDRQKAVAAVNHKMTRKKRINLGWEWIFTVFALSVFLFYPHSTSYRSGNPGIQTLDAWFFFNPLNSCRIWVKGLVLDKSFGSFAEHLNVFLLFPLVFQLLYLCPNLRKTKKIILQFFYWV